MTSWRRSIERAWPSAWRFVRRSSIIECWSSRGAWRAPSRCEATSVNGHCVRCCIVECRDTSWNAPRWGSRCPSMDGCVWIRTYHVLRLLARAFDITALCFERSATSGKGAAWDIAASRDALGRFAAVEVFPIPQRHSRLRYAWDHLRSVALRRVYTAYRYDSRAYHTRLTDLLSSEAFDLVHVDSLGDLAGYLPACRGIPVVCVHHDVESALLQRRAAIERSEWRGAYLRYQARRAEEVERRWCGRVALNVAVSEHDRALLKRMAPAARIAI